MKSYLDYLRIGSWHDTAVLDFAMLRKWANDWKPGKWLQYRGHHSAELNAFYGIGEQGGRRHYIMRIAGSGADSLWSAWGVTEDWYATRIDVQRTIRRPENWDAIEEYRGLQVPRRSKSIIESETGGTIYLGVRTSETFCRIYEKIVDSDKYLRLEFELKGKKALACQAALKQHGLELLDTVFNSLVADFGLPEAWERLFDSSALDAQPHYLAVTRSRKLESVLEWLSSLESSILKYGNDPEIGGTVKAFVASWHRKLDNQDI